jgi:predicted RNA-binding Zn-ribbon protein involved in translation (DUF1610 family)
MPINMACPSCGKTLAAPDTAAGKRAKCPSCGQIMIVPAVTQPAEELGTPPTPSAPPPAGSGGGDSSFDFDTVGSSALSSAPAAGEEARRPCPECGEMIVAGAAKCRFCNAIFDPRLKAQTKKYASTDEDLTPGDWVFCILCGGIACIFGIVYAIQGKPKGWKMVGVSIAASVVWSIIRVIIQSAAGPHGFH